MDSKIISQMFSQNDNFDSFLRIATKYKQTVFIGYNNGLKVMVIEDVAKPIELGATKGIRTEYQKMTNGKIRLYFSLENEKFSSFFDVFCADMIDALTEVGIGKYFEYAAIRWDTWRQFFKNNANKMSLQVIRGLIGELTILHDVMIPKIGFDQAVEAWTGPENTHKDFEYENTWIEVKTCDIGSDSVEISSASQLRSDVVGMLTVVKLAQSNRQNHIAVSLKILVEKILAEGSGYLKVPRFLGKLKHLGFDLDNSIDESYFVVGPLLEYCVDDRFPIIDEDLLPTAIIGVRYRLSLPVIKEFLIGGHHGVR